MATIIKTIFQLKRGTAAQWNKLNLILAVGEPGFETDTGRFKIGDGVTPWSDLNYQDENGTVNCLTHYDFPSVGKSNIIYKAANERKLYQWNEEKMLYETLTGTTDIGEIELINGGDAYGTNT